MRFPMSSLLLLAMLFCLNPSYAQPPAPKLYTDDEIRKLAKHDIDKDYDGGPFGIPCLDVVPAGEISPRAKVFKQLNLEDSRIGDFRSFGIGRVVFLTWQVSPSYDISCMSGARDKLALTDPNREVYGIRLVKRAKETQKGETQKGTFMFAIGIC